MHVFSYTARDQAGQFVSGALEAASQDDALLRLQREGKIVTDIRIGASNVDTEKLIIEHAARSVGREEVITCANQLGIMLETGVPLSDALSAAIEQSRSHHMRRIMAAVAHDVTGGRPLSEALAAFPRVFPQVMVTLVRASEASGAMAEMLLRVSRYLESERKTHRQIKGALTYPFIMLGLSLTVTGFLVMWVLPRFAKIYESREAALPAPTRFLLGLTDAVRAGWVELLVGAATLVAFLLYARSTEVGRRAVDTLKIRLPVIGQTFTLLYLTRAARTLSTLLTAGVPILDAVRISRGVTRNAQWERLWDRCENAMTAGQPISSAILSSRLVPASVAQMIAAGERTGRLPEVLDRVGERAEEELDAAVRQTTQLLEPAMILFMGAAIGGVAIALLLPIFTISNILSH